MFFTRLVVFGVLFIVLGSQAWLAPERCDLNTRYRRSRNTHHIRATRSNRIEDIAATQNARLREKYHNYKFNSMPISANYYPPSYRRLVAGYYSYTLSDCSFYTHSPNLLTSVDCEEGLSCTLSHTVSQVDTYTATEGYNWGVKVSSKFSLFEKVFEVGGEASTGGTYSCAYTKGKTVSDTVLCVDPSRRGGLLKLYNVKSDMKCYYGKKWFEPANRGQYNHAMANAPLATFTPEEYSEIKASSSAIFSIHQYIYVYPKSTPTLDDIKVFIVDEDKLSDRLLNKLLRIFPNYKPSTDLLTYEPEERHQQITVFYYDEVEFEEEYDKIVPFTDEHGNSVYQYACNTLQ